MVRWNKLPGCWQLKDKKRSLLTTETQWYNNIYIYMWGWNCVVCVVFERQTIEVSGWWSLSIQLNFTDSEAFAGEAFVLRDIYFLILLSLVWTSDIFSPVTIKTSIFIEDSPGNKHSRLTNQSQIISYSSTTFWLVSQSNVLIYVLRVSLPRVRF